MNQCKGRQVATNTALGPQKVALVHCTILGKKYSNISDQAQLDISLIHQQTILGSLKVLREQNAEATSFCTM